MNIINEYVEGAIAANSKRVMTGDQAIAAETAASIALTAASMAQQEAIKQTIQRKRLEMACLIFGPIAAAERVSAPAGLGMPELCQMALDAVDEIAKKVHETPVAVPSLDGSKTS